MKIKLFLLFAIYSIHIVLHSMEQNVSKPVNWNKINLPQSYVYPQDLRKKVYSTQFPTTKKAWFEEADCKQYRSTSIRWVSNHLNNISGLSFKGLVYKNVLGKRENEFAVFYHKERCYEGGPEYGWVFPENSFSGLFYICHNCNLNNQKWCQWPGDCKASGNGCAAVEEALKNPAKYRYWNIKVTTHGNFLIELVDPVTFDIHSCKIQKPDWLPNLYKSNGYVTINAKKEAETTVKPPPYIHVDEVKIWQ